MIKNQNVEIQKSLCYLNYEVTINWSYFKIVLVDLSEVTSLLFDSLIQDAF